MRGKHWPVCLALAFTILLAAGCENKENTETKSPLTGEISEKLAEGTRVLYEYDAEDKKQTLYFNSVGDACLLWQKQGHQSENCFCVNGRSNERDGITLELSEKDVIGKWIYVSYWVYHEADENISIGCTLQVVKPDRVTVEWPESVWTGPIPSGKWVYVEGKMPVYADAAEPQLIFEADETYDFLIDDIRITVDDASVTEANYLNVDDEIEPFTGISLDFENDEIYFTNRGNGSGSITEDSYSGQKALLVSERTEEWHGIEKDFFGTQTEGKTLEISCRIKNNEERPVVYAITLSEEKVSKEVIFQTAAQTEEVPAGEWIELKGRVSVGLDTIRPILYFEARDMTASFTIDDVKIDVLEE